MPIKYVFLTILTLQLIACTPDSPPVSTEIREPPGPGSAQEVDSVTSDGAMTEGVSYAVIEEIILDELLKTQIEQHIVATGVPSAQGLSAEIRKRYAVAERRKGFKHHNPASNIYIYVYGSEEQARARQGLWIGMLGKGPSDRGEPRVQIDPKRLGALSMPTEERFGLSEKARRKVFREIAAAEDRATREAMASTPSSQIKKQIEVERELSARYKLEVARNYGLSEDQLLEVAVEGVQNGWPS